VKLAHNDYWCIVCTLNFGIVELAQVEYWCMIQNLHVHMFPKGRREEGKGINFCDHSGRSD